MMNKKFIDQKVEDAMNSIDGIHRASPAAFLLTRINARKQASPEIPNFWYRAAAFIGRPVVAFAGLILFFLINFMVLRSPADPGNAGLANHNSSQYEFAINVSSNYDPGTQEP